MNLTLRPFTAKDAETIRPWFDNPDTIKWLGDEKWIDNIFRLQNESVGTEFRGQHRIAYYPYLALDDDRPVGFVDAGVVDRYVDYGGEIDGKPIYLNIENKKSAGISFVVSPTERHKGYGSAMVKALTEIPELEDVKIFEAGVELENTASIKTLEASGFISNYKPDFENMYYFLLRR